MYIYFFIFQRKKTTIEILEDLDAVKYLYLFFFIFILMISK